MAVSSKSLIRALDNVFTADVASEAGSAAALSAAITAFLDCHNTLSSIKQSANLHAELHRIYESHVRPTSDLERELLFLETLRQLWPFFVEDAALAWLDTYMRPAVDSAGFDLRFAHEARRLLRAMCVEVRPTEDAPLAARRQHLATSAVDRVVQAYLGNDGVRRRALGMPPQAELANNSHEFSERVRYLKMNCTNVVVACGLRHPRWVSAVLQPYVEHSCDRMGALALLSSLVAHEAARTSEIVASDLFGCLLRVVAYDGDARVVAMAVAVVCMMVPQGCGQVGRYLSDLMVGVMGRLSDPPEEPRDKSRVPLEEPWDPKEPDGPKGLEGSSEGDRTASADSADASVAVAAAAAADGWERLPFHSSASAALSFDVHCLVTLLYGLFPLNLIKISQNPRQYLAKFPPRVVQASVCPAGAATALRGLLKTFHLHPNLFALDDASALANEFASPIQWLLDANRGEDLRVEEIAWGCLSLNPELVFAIPAALAPSSSRSNSRASTGSAEEGSFERYLYNLTRRSSLVPRDEPQAAAPRADIRFREVSYDGSTIGDPTGSASALHDLFASHERLYSAAIKGTPESDSADGTAIDFYQRELLLMKNELDFANYMQQLSRYQYARLRLKARADRGGGGSGSGAASREQALKIRLLEERCRALEQTIELDAAEASRAKAELAALRASNKNLELETRSLERQHAAVQHDLHECQHTLAQATRELPQRDAEISRLEAQLRHSALGTHADARSSAASRLVTPRPATPQDDGYFGRRATTASLEPSEHERTVHGLRTEVLLANERIAALSGDVGRLQDLLDLNTRDYQQQLASLKRELASNAATYMAQYERKIQELSATILRYEGLLEAKNAKIVQLSTSKPISIPVSRPMPQAQPPPPADTPRSHSSADTMSSHSRYAPVPPAAPPPVVRTSSAVQPIIKGRGGYQRRAKKYM
ncbi:Uncharacterized protein ABC855_g4656 [[Candida] zeylanoides]